MWPCLMAVLVCAAPAKPGADVPKTMTRVVVRNLSADLPRDSFAAQPKTYYRAGMGYGRVEEALDRERKIHGLIVVDEPRVWMVNLATKSGRTIVDPGPTFVFHANILPRQKGEAAIAELEFGQEPEFMKKHDAVSSKVNVAKRAYTAQRATVDGYELTLLSDPTSGVPRQLKVERDDKVLFELEYLEYRRDLPFEPARFAPPPGIALTEAR